MRFLSLLFALAVGMRTWGVTAFMPSRVDFNVHPVGDANVHTNQDLLSISASNVRTYDGRYHWSTPAATDVVSDAVVSVGTDDHALSISASQVPSNALLRVIAYNDRQTYEDPVDTVIATNVYCDLDVTFNDFAETEGPQVDGEDRLVVFARSGQLWVTAGRYVGSLGTVEAHEFPLASPAVDLAQPHHLTVRTVPTVANGVHALAFALAIDGTNAVIETGFAGPVYRSFPKIREVLTPEARYLLDNARLFPSLTTPGDNRSIAFSGVGFTGEGVVDNILFTNEAPAGVTAPERLFELDWDGGVSALSYWTGTGATNSVPSVRLGDHSLFLAVPSEGADVEVYATYDLASGYTPGLWLSEGCEIVTNVTEEGAVTNVAFRVAAGSDTAVGRVVSYRGEIAVGGGSFSSFAAAKAQAKRQGLGTISLAGDFVTTNEYDVMSSIAGSIVIGPGEDFVLDLNGHTISNGFDQGATIVNYGTLKIIDSVGGGRVVPHADYFAPTSDVQRTAVQNAVMTGSLPALTLAGGTYCGIVTNQGYQLGASMGTVVIVAGGAVSGEPAFIGESATDFPYQDWVTNAATYYAYDKPFWKPLANSFVWCGKGDSTAWNDPANWRGGEVPGTDDTAIFPAATVPWVADLDTFAPVATICFEGEAELSGTADFSSVTLSNTTGRISGGATLTWGGRLPPSLAGVFGEHWRGTVAVTNVGVSSPKLMNNIATWGTESSKVLFKDVRGYCHAVTSYTMPYELVLENGAAGYGWKNDAGFTGSVLAFARLSGDGSFVSPKNTISNYQTIRFTDVSAYTGKLDVLGKRIVLGAGKPNASAGSITWSDGVTVTVSASSVHSCAVAAFLGALNATASFDDAVATYTTRAVGADAVVVTLLPGGARGELQLDESTDPKTVKIAKWSDTASVVDGRRVASTALLTATTGSRIFATSTAAAKSLSFASYYTASVGEPSAEDGMIPVTLALDESKVLPVIGGSCESATFGLSDGEFTVTVTNAKKGLWYRLEHADVPNATETEWAGNPDEAIWQMLNSGEETGEISLSMPCEGSPSGYYRVLVTDVPPAGYEEEE